MAKLIAFDQEAREGIQRGVDTLADTFSAGYKLPEYVFVAFQATFAGITGALIVGAFAERGRKTNAGDPGFHRFGYCVSRFSHGRYLGQSPRSGSRSAWP